MTQQNMEDLIIKVKKAMEAQDIDMCVSNGKIMASLIIADQLEELDRSLQFVAKSGCAIAKAIVEHTKDKKLKEKFMKYDRQLLVDDSRRTEPKKPLGKKARKKKQSSKR